ncbi:hypothetical protein GGQ74_000540 [Desulfobaculum xiamenense]|uniref:Uncharacterized protein n=1 Tax=Desulfobaculum xiamenense TaxID=995050 RepID=A0A846QII1_9BACT|nr:hypothetical protein [Desulfobaculum xiamenense]NJB66900.1 hypothetical protein [Desulfobaculum xiamenense]
MDSKTAVLQTRLMNCLETIIELEQDLERLELGHVLLDEFSQLKAFMKRIDQVNVDEDDVRRIERATSNFLEELKAPMGIAALGSERTSKLVQ